MKTIKLEIDLLDDRLWTLCDNAMAKWSHRPTDSTEMGRRLGAWSRCVITRVALEAERDFIPPRGLKPKR